MQIHKNSQVLVIDGYVQFGVRFRVCEGFKKDSENL